jgi:hypothetical protein
VSATPNGVDCTVVRKGAGSACDDGNLGTANDVCDGAGGCGGIPITCPADTACTAWKPDGVDCAPSWADSETACDDGDVCTEGDACDGAGACVGVTLACAVGEACDAVEGCVATHCEPCASDADCGDASACLATGSGDTSGDRCLLACATATDCPEGLVCGVHTDGSRRCFDLEGDCAAPSGEPGPDTDPVEPGPEPVEPAPVESGPEPVEPAPVESGPEPVEPAPVESGSVEPALDAGPSADVTSSGQIPTSGGGGCGGGGAGAGPAALLLALGVALLRARSGRSRRASGGP